jgi:3-deoxy-D-manno-octulosonic-acid transferase
MLRAGYSLFLWLAFPFFAIRLWVRSRREPGYSKGLGERFGRFQMEAGAPLIWIHAVSVGEVRASMPLVAALRREYPEHALLVTCMTASGREAIDQVYGKNVLAAFLPYDYPFAVRRFLDHFRPRIGILVETEIWINLLAECRRRLLPVMLANGRMSSKSAKGYRRLSVLTRPAFESLAAVCAQSESDANRLASLGAHHVSVSGNLKFDVQPDAHLLAAGAELKRSFGRKKVLMLASTREGEEALLLNVLRDRLSDDTLLIIVPRHPQRFEEAAALLAGAGLSFARRSRDESVAGKKVLLGDTMGEMPVYYAAADVAVIGGTLLPYGGQNLIEACAIGVPVILGPHAYNFSEATRAAVDCGAAIQVANAGEAIRSACALLDDPARREAMGSAGLAFCARHRGATARHIDAIRGFLTPEDMRARTLSRA